MIRFIDLSEEYWTDPEENGAPICAFLSTSDGRFLTAEDGQQTFSSFEDVLDHPQAARLVHLLPFNFFNDTDADFGRMVMRTIESKGNHETRRLRREIK